MAKLLSVTRGRALPLASSPHEPHGATALSGIVKTPASTLEAPDKIEIGPLGVEGDEQADLTVHGGRDKAVYAYPSEHYPVWQTLRLQATGDGSPLPYGFMGENFTLAGIVEGDIYIGDVLSVGSEPDAVLLRVTAPRVPCFKFNRRMGFAQASKMMLQSGYTGFYLEVMQAGAVRAGAEVTVLPSERVVSVLEQTRLLRKRA